MFSNIIKIKVVNLCGNFLIGFVKCLVLFIKIIKIKVINFCLIIFVDFVSCLMILNWVLCIKVINWKFFFEVLEKIFEVV